jgi:hypothetical protein
LCTVQSLNPADAVRCCCFRRPQESYGDSAGVLGRRPCFWNLVDTFGASDMEAYAVHREITGMYWSGSSNGLQLLPSRQLQRLLKELHIPQFWLLHIPAQLSLLTPHDKLQLLVLRRGTHSPLSVGKSPQLLHMIVRVHPACYYMCSNWVHRHTSIRSSQHTIASSMGLASMFGKLRGPPLALG